MKLNEIVDDKLAEIKKKLQIFKIKNYTIRDDGVVDVDGDVDLSMNNIDSIPVKFGIVKGNFIINDNYRLKSLKGSPDEVYGDFRCTHCALINLKGAPKVVKKIFDCSFNDDLEEFGQQLPDEVYGFYCLQLKNLKSLKGSPKKINGIFYTSSNASLTSLNSDTEYVGETFNSSGCSNVTSLSGLPPIIKGTVGISGMPKAKNLLALFNVEGITKLTSTTELPKYLKIVNKYIQDGYDYAGCQEALIEAGFEEYAEF